MRVGGRLPLFLIPLGLLSLALAGCQNAATGQEVLTATTRVVQERAGEATAFVPYWDLTRVQPTSVRAAMSATGVSAFTVGPITGAAGFCIPMWGTSATQDLTARKNAREILDAGGRLTLSFGSASGQVVGSLADHCQSPKDLAFALEHLVTAFTRPGQPAGLDFRLDDNQLEDRPAQELLVAALHRLQDDSASRPAAAAAITLTFPGDAASGLSRQARAMIGDLLDAGVALTSVTVDVANDHRAPATDQLGDATGLGAAAIAAATRAAADLRAVYASRDMPLSAAQAWRMLGMRVTIGEGRATARMPRPVFTLSDAVSVAAFSRGQAQAGRPLHEVSIWSFNRDHACPRGGSGEPVDATWALPQLGCNLVGGEYGFTRILSG